MGLFTFSLIVWDYGSHQRYKDVIVTFSFEKGFTCLFSGGEFMTTFHSECLLTNRNTTKYFTKVLNRRTKAKVRGWDSEKHSFSLFLDPSLIMTNY